jgi:hypothetical protein
MMRLAFIVAFKFMVFAEYVRVMRLPGGPTLHRFMTQYIGAWPAPGATGESGTACVGRWACFLGRHPPHPPPRTRVAPAARTRVCFTGGFPACLRRAT